MNIFILSKIKFLNNMISKLYTINIKILYHKLFTMICDGLYNVMRNNETISTFVVGMLLEMKMVIFSNQTQNLDLNRIITHFDNFKKMFTPLEKETNLNLNEPISCSLKLNVKRKKIRHEINKKRDKPNSTLLSHKKSNHVDYVLYLVIEQLDELIKGELALRLVVTI